LPTLMFLLPPRLSPFDVFSPFYPDLFRYLRFPRSVQQTPTVPYRFPNWNVLLDFPLIDSFSFPLINHGLARANPPHGPPFGISSLRCSEYAPRSHKLRKMGPSVPPCLPFFFPNFLDDSTPSILSSKTTPVPTSRPLAYALFLVLTPTLPSQGSSRS